MKTQLVIEGMSCEKCVGRVKKGLNALVGVHSAEVSLSPGGATIEHESSVSPEQILAAVAKAGYQGKVA